MKVSNYDADASLKRRFLAIGWNEVIRVPSLGLCWEWRGSKNKRRQNSGQISYGRRSEHKVLKTYRVAYELWIGPIPEGQCVCHRCDNPSCVNPQHLFLGTVADNNQDKAAKGRAVYPVLPGELSPSAKLTLDEVRSIRHALENGERGADLARQYGVTKSAISSIKYRKVWRDDEQPH